MTPAEARQCKECGAEYMPHSFYHFATGRPYSYCKPCWNKRSSSKNRDRSAYRQSPKGKAQDLIATARRRANQYGLAFDLSIEWLERKLGGCCEVTGLAFDLSKGKRRPYSPTLDQIDPRGGYTESNVLVVVWMYNAAKGDWTHDDVMTMAAALIGGSK